MQKIIILLMVLINVSMGYSQVVINEVYYDSPGSDAGTFTELYGEPGTDLAEWKLIGINGSNGDEYSSVTLMGTIHNNGFFVIAQHDTVANADLVTSSVNWQNGPDNVILINATGDTVDAVGYGEFDADEIFVGETLPAPDAANASLGRKIDGHDTDNNADDFIVLDFPSPGEHNAVNHDLAIFDSGISFSVDDNSVGISATIHNFGAISYSPDEASLNFYANQALLGTESISDPIAPFDSTIVEFSWQNVDDGLHQIRVEIDFSDDQNMENNQAENVVRVGEHPVVINEIMYDPDTDCTEWIELYNRSETESVNLQDWTFADANLSPKLVTADSVPLLPENFIIIANDLTEFVLQFPDSDTNFVITPSSWNALNNSGDAIIFWDSFGIAADSLYYTDNWGGGDGISLERINYFMASEDSTNWAASVADSGGTPLRRNSVAARDYDLAITPNDISVSDSLPTAGETMEIYITVHNIGFEDVSGASLALFDDQNENGVQDSDEGIAETELPTISAMGGSANITIEWHSIPSGNAIITARIIFPQDENLSNNIAAKSLQIRQPDPQIIINEIMFAPDSDDAEWIEFFNTSPTATNCRTWKLGKGTEEFADGELITESEALIEGEGFFIITDDVDVFMAKYPNVSCPVFPLNLSLRNSGDTLKLWEATGVLSDSVAYSDAWETEAGFSLERINPKNPSNEGENWHFCTAAIGGTPGEVNSVYIENISRESKIQASPNPFSPDGDGVDELTRISYEIPEMVSEVNLRIYDVRGRLVRKLLQGDVTSSKNSVIWDGKDDGGELLPIGIYIIFYEAINNQNGKTYSGKTTVVLAKKL